MEQIIFAPGISGNELTKSMAYFGHSKLGMRVFGSGEFARYVLMCSGVSINDNFINADEECILIAEAVKGNTYFKQTSYSDIVSITKTIRQIRNMIGDEDEENAVCNILGKGMFKEKNKALVEVYQKYMNLLHSGRQIDQVSLVRKALAECRTLDVEFISLEEYPLSPLEEALISKVSGGSYSKSSICDVYGLTRTPVKINSIRNCFGSPNEVETIIEDIYRNGSLDKCTVALTDPGSYSQLFFDCALVYDIPMTFGCGVPITNSNPAKLLALYYRWMTSGQFGKEAVINMLKSDAFNRFKLQDDFKAVVEEFHWSVFYDCVGNIKFKNDPQYNKSLMDKYEKALIEDGKYIKEGESREYKEYKEKVKILPLVRRMSEELALPIEEFISKYSLIRWSGSRESQKMIHALDSAALSAITQSIVSMSRIQSLEEHKETILNILSQKVMRQSSQPGAIHITDIGKAICSIREDMYIAGLAASLYPGSPKENYLLLDCDIELFGEGAGMYLADELIRRKRDALTDLVRLSSVLGAKVSLSYAGMNVSDLKADNASSMIYELASETKAGGSITAEELGKMIKKVSYFEPAISSSRLVGEAYIGGKKIDHKGVSRKSVSVPAPTDGSYSPSALTVYFGCPKKYLLSSILHIAQPDEYKLDEVIAANERGTLIHSLMERLADDKTMDLDGFLSLSEEFFDRYIDEHRPIMESNVKKEKDDFLNLMQTLYEMDDRKDVLLQEEDVKHAHETGINIHGFPDRVEKNDDGTYKIVDFKTGRQKEHVKDDFESCMQVIIYAYLIETLGPEYKVSGGEFRYPRYKQSITCKYDDDMKDQLSKALNRFKDDMAAGKFPCATDENVCKYCKGTYDQICGKNDAVSANTQEEGSASNG